MSNYSKSTNFASKDSLASGNPLKVIKGTEIDDEFEALETAVGTKADLASPTFTGTPAAPTAASGTNTTQIATTAFVSSAISGAYGDWTISVSGTSLIFSYNGTAVAKIESNGHITSVHDVTAYGTI
jgi:hypothetical protein